MKSGTLDLMKFKLLMRDLGESIRGAAGILEVLWQRACKDCPRGDIGRFSNDEIAVMADYQGDADALVAALVRRGWIDENETHRLVIHDWHEHAPNYVKGVVARKGGFATQGEQPKVGNPESATNGTPPPIPSLTKPYQASPSLPSPWSEVVDFLLSLGIAKAEEACQSAASSGCQPMHVRNLAEFWRGNIPRWGHGALHDRIGTLRPEQDIAALWPDESEEVKRLESNRKHKEKLAKQLSQREAADAERKRNIEERKQMPPMLEQFKGLASPEPPRDPAAR